MGDELAEAKVRECRAAVKAATMALGARGASLAGQAAAYRRRAASWATLAQALPHHPSTTPAIEHAAADDLMRAHLLEAAAAAHAHGTEPADAHNLR